MTRSLMARPVAADRSRRRGARPLAALAVAVAVGLCAPPARAFDAATTHAGLTEQAALASRLGRVLRVALGLPLGLYEPLAIDLPHDARGESLALALARLDPAEGYAPSATARLPAIGWLVAGSVVEEVPAERVRHHFYDPTTRRGLTQGGYLEGAGLRLASALDGAGTVRGLFTGASLDGTGLPSVSWLASSDNDLSLDRFVDARERAVTAPTARARAAALAEALLAAGALTHVVEDAGEPALVRNDLRVELAGGVEPFRRYVAERYGRLGLPDAPGGAQPVVHLADLITAPDGSGLADRTARRFFSLGTLPERGRRAHAAPSVTAGAGASGYAAGGEGVPHLAAWRRTAVGVEWALDERCYADYAAAILPEVARSARSAIEHLFRGELTAQDGGVRVVDVTLGRGRVTVLADDAHDARRVVSTRDVSGVAAGEVLVELTAPPGARRLAVVFRGVDGAGEPIVLSIEKSVE